MNYYGWNPPFIGGRQNVMSRQSGDRLIKNDLLQLLMTNPGERVMRPTWGAGLKQLVFEQLDDMVEIQVKENLQQLIAQYEPRISAQVDVQADPDNHVLNIKVAGQYTDQPNQQFEMEINVPVGEAK